MPVMMSSKVIWLKSNAELRSGIATTTSEAVTVPAARAAARSKGSDGFVSTVLTLPLFNRSCT